MFAGAVRGAGRAACRAASVLAAVIFVSLGLGAAADPPRTVGELASELAHPDVKVRREAAWGLAHFPYDAKTDSDEIERAVAGLIETLEDRDHQVWYESVSALARLGPRAQAAVPALAGHLGREGGRRRGGGQRAYRTAYALGKIGRAAVPALVELLQSRSSAQRASAALALTWVGADGEDAVPALVGVLDDEDEIVREHAASALGAIGEPAVGPLVQVLGERRGPADEPARIGAVSALGQMPSIDEAARKALEGVLDDSSPRVRARALTALRLGGAPEADVARIAAAKLSDPDEQVREAAVLALLKARRFDELVVPELDTVFAAGDAVAVRAAATVLARAASDPAAVSGSLARAILKADDPATRDQLARALGRGGEAALSAILASLRSDSCSDAGAAAFVRALVDIGPGAAPTLIEALGAEAARVRASAAVALGDVGKDSALAVEALARAVMDPDDRVAASAARGLGALGEPARGARGVLLTAASERSAVVRAASLEALGALGADAGELVPALRAALDSEVDALRLAALTVVAALGAEAKSLVVEVTGALASSAPSVRAAAATALGSIGPDAGASVPALLAVFDPGDDAAAPDASVRFAVVGALGGIGAGGAAVDTLSRVVEQEDDEELALAAIVSLGQIGPEAKRSANVLRARLDGGSATLRAQALASLARVARKDAVDDLVRLLRDDSPTVRSASVEALGALGGDAQAAVPALFQMLDRSYEQEAALAALRKIRPADLDVLRKGLRHRETTVQVFAAECLGELGAEAQPAAADLRRVVETEKAHWQVRRSARQALTKIESASRDDPPVSEREL